jgi:hypothetical protein
MGMIERTAEAILRGDAAKSAGEPWNGQRFVDVKKAVCEDDDMPIVTVTLHDGREGNATVRGELVKTPKDRTMAVVDLEPAVDFALVEAVKDAREKSLVPSDVPSAPTHDAPPPAY